MSTQPFSTLSETGKPFTTEATEEHRVELKSLLDEPWKVTLIPAEAPVGEDPHAAKSPTKSPRSRVIAT